MYKVRGNELRKTLRNEGFVVKLMPSSLHVSWI